MSLEIVPAKSARAKELRASGLAPFLESSGEQHFDVPVHLSSAARMRARTNAPVAGHATASARELADSKEPVSIAIRRREDKAKGFGTTAALAGVVFLAAAVIGVGSQGNEGCGTPTGCTAPTWGVPGWLTLFMLVCFIAAGIALVVERTFERRAVALESAESKRQDEIDVNEAIEAHGRRILGTRRPPH